MEKEAIALFPGKTAYKKIMTHSPKFLREAIRKYNRFVRGVDIDKSHILTRDRALKESLATAGDNEELKASLRATANDYTKALRADKASLNSMMVNLGVIPPVIATGLGSVITGAGVIAGARQKKMNKLAYLAECLEKKAETVEDNKGPSKLLSGLAAAGGTSAVSLASTMPILLQKSDTKEYNKLLNLLKSKNYADLDIKQMADTVTNRAKPVYMPKLPGHKKPYIKITKGQAGSAAHEAGHYLVHSKSPNKWKWLGASRNLSALSGLPVLFSDDPTTGAVAATAGSALALPTLVDEIQASAKGSSMMKQLPNNPGMFKRLKPYIGVPSYAAFAASPWIMYYIKKLLGSYDKKSNTKGVKNEQRKH